MSGGTCSVCSSPARQFCAGCKVAFYCSREHQKQHWRIHKAQCRPFKVEQSDILGKYMMATRDMNEGEVVMTEEPIVLGPRAVSTPLCLGCHKSVDGGYQCSRCSWTLCSKDCELSDYHKPECELLNGKKFEPPLLSANEKTPIYGCILILRCLSFKKNNESKWATITALQSHLAERKNTLLYKSYKKNIVDFIRIGLGLEEFDEDAIFEVCGISDTNAFDVRHSGGPPLRALFPGAAMMEHNCKPNTKHVFDRNFNLKVMATIPIKKGDHISTTYTQTLWSTLRRRAHLKEAKYFDCKCQRCTDPTELGTYLSALRCTKCLKGTILSADPLNPAAEFRCDSCPHSLLSKQVQWGNEALKKEIEMIDKTTPKYLEEFLEKYKAVLHTNNSYLTEVRYALSQMYGNSPGYTLPELSDSLLDKKIELCHTLLDIADSLDPGLSRFRGLLLYDLQAAMVIQAKRDLASEKVTPEMAQEVMKDAVGLLQQATAILKEEPDMQNILETKLEEFEKQLNGE